MSPYQRVGIRYLEQEVRLLYTLLWHRLDWADTGHTLHALSLTLSKP